MGLGCKPTGKIKSMYQIIKNMEENKKLEIKNKKA